MRCSFEVSHNYIFRQWMRSMGCWGLKTLYFRVFRFTEAPLLGRKVLRGSIALLPKVLIRDSLSRGEKLASECSGHSGTHETPNTFPFTSRPIRGAFKKNTRKKGGTWLQTYSREKQRQRKNDVLNSTTTLTPLLRVLPCLIFSVLRFEFSFCEWVPSPCSFLATCKVLWSHAQAPFEYRIQITRE